MKQTNREKAYVIGQIVKACIMLAIGCFVLVPNILLLRSSFPLLFGLVWIGSVGYVLVRNIIRLQKINRESLDDTLQYYDQTETQNSFVPSAMERQGNMTTCPHCGRQVPEVFDYCNSCGRKQ